MFYQLPPVGSPVRLSLSRIFQGTASGAASSGSDTEPLSSLVPTGRAVWFDSGTSALSACMRVAADARLPDRLRAEAEVILPAYACPDLVSAAVHAGLRPVLIDLVADRPWLDLEQLANAINDNTAAVVAVNFLGLGERWQQLRQLCDDKGVLLIEDSAQYYPSDAGNYQLNGDMAIFSFGRGKPVSLLGGGAATSRHVEYLEALQSLAGMPGPGASLSYLVRGIAYNVLVSPWLYWIPQSLPFLKLGETRFHALERIQPIDAVRKRILSDNICQYEAEHAAALSRREQMSRALQAVMSSGNSLVEQDLPLACECPATQRLLRYPLLLRVDARQQAYRALLKAGLGASLMYPDSLPRLPGVAKYTGTGTRTGKPFPNAESFAARIVTLPVHNNVRQKDIDRIADILRQI